MTRFRTPQERVDRALRAEDRDRWFAVLIVLALCVVLGFLLYAASLAVAP